MKPSPEQKTYIQQKFSVLNSKQDLLILLNEAKRMMYGEDIKPLRLKALNYYSNPNFCEKRYTTFSIPKKNGCPRAINAPVKGLRSILRVLNYVLQAIYEPHPAAMGFVNGKSIVDNAQKHIAQNYVYNLDLKDFFHSFDRNQVKLGLMKKPFLLREEKEEIAFFISSLCTHPFKIDGEVKITLPQGSPTSPTITNILCRDLDRRLNGLAKRFNVNYSRYADDITFSSSHNIYNNEDFQNELKRIIEDDQNLKINPSKTRLQKNGFRKEVTGLVVNDKINVRKKYIKQLRMWLYYWEKYGYKKAENNFRRDYILDKGHTENVESNMSDVIDGKLEFLKMVKGEEDSTYKKLRSRYSKLSPGSHFINKILITWEVQGLDKAIEIYKEKTKHSKESSITVL